MVVSQWTQFRYRRNYQLRSKVVDDSNPCTHAQTRLDNDVRGSDTCRLALLSLIAAATGAGVHPGSFLPVFAL